MKKRILLSALLGTSLWAVGPDPKKSTKVNGTLKGFSGLASDGFVDAGLIYTALKPEQVITFQIEDLLAPNEMMTVGPKEVGVPGNLYFPAQKEWWGFLPVNMSKESFSLLVPATESSELSGLWVRASFQKIIDFSQNTATLGEVLASVENKKGLYYPENPWGERGPLNLTLNQNLAREARYNWEKLDQIKERVDSVINFQKTPEARWVLSDLGAPKPQGGAIARFHQLEPSFKTLFLSSYFKSGASIPYEVTAWVKTWSGNQGASARGPNVGLKGVKFLDRKHIEWVAPEQPGWMTVMIAEKAQGLMTPEHPLNKWTDALFNPFQKSNSSTVEWFSPQSGRYDLGTTLADNAEAFLVFVATDRDVPKPTFESNQKGPEPALFTYASEIKITHLNAK